MHRPFAIGDHYELAQLIGVGGASFVFGGRDVRDGREVAVKILRARASLGHEAQRRELDELALSAYDRVSDVVEVGWDDALGVTYLVTSQLSGQAGETAVQQLLALDTLAAAAAEPPEVFEVPATIGSYRVMEALGTGGHGRVYLGLHPVIGSKVAIKMLRPDIARSAETVERFIQEARASSQIGSPHIPRYFDFGRTPSGVPYAIMEYFEGETLGARLARGTMSVSETAQVVEQVASALAMAHDAGLIHRDLKPDNLFLVKPDLRRSSPAVLTQSSSGVRPAGEAAIDVKVLDFGIAKMVGTLSATRTESGSFLGTPYYCAPEQVFGRPVDARTDVYCLGATAYEMLTGSPPFVGEVHEILSAKAIEEPPELRVPGVPPAVADTIRKMIARDPEDRAPSMTWVLAQLTRWTSAGELGRAATESTWNETGRTVSQTIPEIDAPLSAAQPTVASGSRRRIALVAAGVLAVAGVAIGVPWSPRGPGRTGSPAGAARTVEPSAGLPPAGGPPSSAVPSATAPPAASAPAVQPAPLQLPHAVPPRSAPVAPAQASATPARAPAGAGSATEPGGAERGRPSGEGRAIKHRPLPRSAKLPVARPQPQESAVPPPRPGDSKDVMIVDPFAPAP